MNYDYNVFNGFFQYLELISFRITHLLCYDKQLEIRYFKIIKKSIESDFYELDHILLKTAQNLIKNEKQFGFD